MKRCFFVILIGLQILSNGAINYCGSRMCGHTNEHTFCKYPLGPGSACTGYMQVALSTADKARILARLNRRRSDVAMGLDDWPPAGDMLKLRWVEELSREAQLWADQCSPPKHPENRDSCRDLYSVSVGQCVASIVGESPGLRPETMVDIWYMQRISYRGNFTFYSPTSNNYYGDFAQMIWSRAYMVGCGRSRFMAQIQGRVRSVERLVCNFAPRGPIPFRALWTPGAPASMCPPRTQPDSIIPGLCTHQYDIDGSQDVDNGMTPEEHLLLNTVLEIENNNTLDYIGSLDEHYLRRLAISTIENNYTTELNYNNFVNKREVIEDIGMEENSEKGDIKIEIANKSSVISITPIKHATRRKLNYKIVGRPKAYNLADLEDETTPAILKNDLVDSSDKNDLYVDLEYTEIEDNSDVTTTELVTKSSNSDATQNLVTKSQRNITSGINDTDTYNKFWNTSIIFNVSNLSINDTKNDADLDDYLSDPETFRQLQEALERVEYSLSIPTTTVGKVRREIRDLDDSGQFTRKPRNYLSPEEMLELERNKTRERGPMLSMVMKYIPYLQPYEKTILGEDRTNAARRMMPSIILLLVLCM